MTYSISKTKPDCWDEWLLKMEFQAGFLQTSYWADISSHVNGSKFWYIEVFDPKGERIAGGLVALEKDEARLTFKDKLKGFISGQDKGTLKCIDGPVIPNDASLDIWEIFLDAFDEIQAKTKARYIEVGNLPILSDKGMMAEIEHLFTSRGYDKFVWETSLVDLQHTEDEIFDSFKANARKGIRKCIREGISIVECSDLETFEEKFFFPQHDKNEGTSLHWWHIDQRRHYRYFYATDNSGQTLGTLGVYNFNGISVEIMSERMQEGKSNNLTVQDLLHWHAFKECRNSGNLYFDLAGFNPNPLSPKEKGIRKFKEKWSGQHVTLVKFHRVKAGLTYRMIKWIIRKWVKR